MKIRKTSAKTLDKAADKVPLPVANLILAPLRRTHPDPCTCGQADCPERNRG